MQMLCGGFSGGLGFSSGPLGRAAPFPPPRLGNAPIPSLPRDQGESDCTEGLVAGRSVSFLQSGCLNPPLNWLEEPTFLGFNTKQFPLPSARASPDQRLSPVPPGLPLGPLSSRTGQGSRQRKSPASFPCLVELGLQFGDRGLKGTLAACTSRPEGAGRCPLQQSQCHQHLLENRQGWGLPLPKASSLVES